MVKLGEEGGKTVWLCGECGRNHSNRESAEAHEAEPHIKLTTDYLVILGTLYHASDPAEGSLKEILRAAGLSDKTEERKFMHMRAELLRSGILSEKGLVMADRGRGQGMTRSYTIDRRKIARLITHDPNLREIIKEFSSADMGLALAIKGRLDKMEF